MRYGEGDVPWSGLVRAGTSMIAVGMGVQTVRFRCRMPCSKYGAKSGSIGATK